MRRLLVGLAVVVGGTLALAFADFAAISVGNMTNSGEWIVNISELVVSLSVGVLGGRILRKDWCAIGLSPVLYFGHLSVIMSNPKLLYIGLNAPLALLTLLTAGFLGASTSRRA
jgi:hypothetical protein